MEKDYLHKINLARLLSEIEMTKDELAELSGYSRANNLIKWEQSKDKGGTRPSYNTLVKLMQSGASAETLFGVKQSIREENVILTDEELSRAFRRAADILNQSNKEQNG